MTGIQVSGTQAPPEHEARGSRLMAITGGVPAFALLVLFGLYFFDQFDTAAFNVLAPDIEHSFHLSDKSFGLIVIANLTLVLLFAVLIGHYGDRLPRTRIVVLGGVLAGTFSFLTGLAGTLVLLVLFRLGNGIGQVVNEPIHNSLLADYYPPRNRPGVYALHQNAVFLGAIVGPVVAGVASTIGGWRAAFVILIVPILAVSFIALRLRDPLRGGTDDPDGAAEVQAEQPVSFQEAARTLLAVPTLRRQYIAYFFIGAGVIPLAFLLPLYLKRVYGLGNFDRGMIVAANAAFQFAGVIASARWTRKWVQDHPGEPLRRAGMGIAAVGIGLLLVAIAPDLGLAIVLGFATSFAGGIFYPPFFTVQAAVSPARVRTLSFGFGSFWLVAGVWCLWVIFEGSLADKHGLRVALGALLPFWLIGGAVLASAKRFVAGDAAKAAKILATTIELKRQRSGSDRPPLLRCTGIDVAYDKVQVLFDVDFEVQDGEIVALLGTNGAGKSTLLKAISGLVLPSGGAVYFDGRDVTQLDAVTSTELGIVQMPGGRSVFPTLTVAECMKLAGWIHRRQDPAHVAVATREALGYFPILADRWDSLAGNLSGGEQQMLGLAMAFVAKPKLLMIDELSLGLAPTIVSQLVDIVRAIHARGTTIVIVEQSVNVALTLAERAVFMEKGEVRFSGPTSDLLDRSDILRSVFLEGAAVATGHSTNGTNGTTKAAGKDGANGGANGKSQALVKPPELAGDAAAVLEVDELVVRFGGVQAVGGAGLSLRSGEILGLIGPNGAGKTTIFDTISGFVVPQSGTIKFCGQDITAWASPRRAMLGLGRSFQDARLFPSLTVAENIAIAFERHLDVRDAFAAALALPCVEETETQVAWDVHDLIELLGLQAFRNKFVSELSTGSRRIVDLAMCLAHRPKVLMLDEPSSGIAQRETEALGPLLLRVREQLGCSMLVIEHDMPLITSISNTMVALELGRVITTGTPREVVNHPAVVASYLGTDEAAVQRSGVLDLGGRQPARRTTKTTRKKAAAPSKAAPTKAGATKAAPTKAGASKAGASKAGASKAGASAGAGGRRSTAPKEEP